MLLQVLNDGFSSSPTLLQVIYPTYIPQLLVMCVGGKLDFSVQRSLDQEMTLIKRQSWAMNLEQDGMITVFLSVDIMIIFYMREGRKKDAIMHSNISWNIYLHYCNWIWPDGILGPVKLNWNVVNSKKNVMGLIFSFYLWNISYTASFLN